MTDRKKVELLLLAVFLGVFVLLSATTRAQLPDRTQNPNTAGASINKLLSQQIGAGRGDRMTPNSSAMEAEGKGTPPVACAGFDTEFTPSRAVRNRLAGRRQDRPSDEPAKPLRFQSSPLTPT